MEKKKKASHDAGGVYSLLAHFQWNNQHVWLDECISGHGCPDEDFYGPGVTPQQGPPCVLALKDTLVKLVITFDLLY